MTSKPWLILGILATVIYFYGIKGDLPYSTNSDEFVFVTPAIQFLSTGEFHISWFTHPAGTVILPLIPVFHIFFVIFYNMEFLKFNPKVYEIFTLDSTNFYVLARSINVIYGILTILLTYYIAKKLYGGFVGFAAGLLTIFTPTLVWVTKLARTDGTATFLGLLSIFWILKLLDKNSPKNQTITGVIIGLLIATKYYMASMTLVLLLVIRKVSSLSRIFFMAVLTFILVLPFLLLNWSTTYKSILYELNHSNPGADGFSFFGNLIWYLTHAIPVVISYPAFFLACFGIFIAIYNKTKKEAVLVIFVVLHLITISVSSLHWEKWLVQVIPILWIFVSLGLKKLVGSRNILYWVIVMALLINPASKIILNSQTKDTRILSREWVLTNISSGSRIAQEYYSAILLNESENPPVGIYKLNFGTKNFIVKQQFSLVDPEGLKGYYCQGFNILITSSDIYDRYLQKPSLYPKQVKFYNTLFKEGKLLKKFTPLYFQINNSIINIFELDGKNYSC